MSTKFKVKVNISQQVNADVFQNILELGKGWRPTVLETELEHDFIRQSQKSLWHPYDYFIAGSRYPEQTGYFPYHVSVNTFDTITEILYSTNQSGNWLK